MKVLIATEKPFAAVAVDGMRKVIEEAGAELVLLEKYTDKQALLDAVADVDGLLIRSESGQDTPGQNSNAVAELVFGLAVMMCRNMYNGTSGTELKDKTLGIQAFGQVGRNVARIARGFEMNISALDPYCPDNVMEDAGVSPVHSVEQLYRENKVVSIHIPATPETKGSIGYDLIASMPKGGLLINTAGKKVMSEEGLIKALEERQDLKYAADVAPERAMEIKERFGDRVFFTPKKMGAQTSEANINAGLAAARQVIAFLTTGEARFKVNK